MADFGSMSANQINASMGFGPGGVGDQSQWMFNNLYGPQGFGSSTYGMVGGYPSFGEPSGPGSIYDPNAGSRGSPPTGYDYGSLYSTGNQQQAPAYDYTSLGGRDAIAAQLMQPGANLAGSLGDQGVQPFNSYSSQPWWSTFVANVGPQAAQDWATQQSGGGAAPQPQPQPQPQSWGDWLGQYQVPAGPQPGEGSMSPAADAIRDYLAPTQAPAYDYTSLYQQPSWLSQYQVPAGPQPGEGSMSPAADAIRNYLAPTSSGSDNPYGVDAGTWASMNAGDRATFNRTMGGQGAVPSTGGGIGSDAGQSPGQYQNQNPVVDWNKYFNMTTSDYPINPTVSPSSPGSNSQTPGGWSQIPTNGPYPNLGYNPGMANTFAPGGGMQQYNPQQMTNDLQRTLGIIDRSTAGGYQDYPSPTPNSTLLPQEYYGGG